MSRQMDSVDTLIIGGGIIGLTIAYHLARQNRSVLVLDPAGAGSGASYGNAGTIADYAITPVGSPAVLKNLPSLLFDRDSPLAIQRSALLTTVPWLMRFIRQSFSSQFHQNVDAILPLVKDAAVRWRELAAAVDGNGMLQSRGCLYYYPNEAGLVAGKRDIQFRRSKGIEVELLDLDQLRQLEPALNITRGGAAYFPDSLFLSDPAQMNQLIYQALLDSGGEFQQEEVVRLNRQGQAVSVKTASGREISANHIVLAAGAHSRHLAAQIGDKIPLIAERGYHLEYDMPDLPLRRPVSYGGRGFYICPMSGRLRVAGTVELGNTNPEMSAHRLEVMDRGVRTLFPGLPAADRNWLGFRPSLPDSIPLISHSSQSKKVIYAFGHGHIGMTLAPVTAELVSELIADKASAIPLQRYSVNRF